MSRIAGLVRPCSADGAGRRVPRGAQVPAPPKTPTAVGSGGSAASVDPLATQAAIDVLRSGGNAVDAAVAAAGVLGVVEPFSCGIGGGGFMVIYDAKHHRVDTIDSREAAPRGHDRGRLRRARPAKPASSPRRASAASASASRAPCARGRPRSSATAPRSLVAAAARREDRAQGLPSSTRPSTSRSPTTRRSSTTSPPAGDLYLTPAKTAKPVGDVQRNPDLAATYERIGARPGRFYHGRDRARHLADRPASAAGAGLRPPAPGAPRLDDAARPRGATRRSAASRRKIGYRGLDIYGMGPPSSGGSTVGEALNILEGFPRNESRTDKLHQYLEASKLAYADRNEYVGDPASHRRAAARPALRPVRGRAPLADRPTTALPTPQDPGDPWQYNGGGHGGHVKTSSDAEGPSTTHLTVADRWGNVVTYTFTIEQIGGSGMVVPGRGFLLNNELTDFNFGTGTANSPGPGKRPRSSMAPTIVFDHGRPVVALGSPGGATIITTVLQILVNQHRLRADACPTRSRRRAPPSATASRRRPSPRSSRRTARAGGARPRVHVVTPNPPARSARRPASRSCPAAASRRRRSRRGAAAARRWWCARAERARRTVRGRAYLSGNHTREDARRRGPPG